LCVGMVGGLDGRSRSCSAVAASVEEVSSDSEKSVLGNDGKKWDMKG
jgi:hypothetical protein